jgi:hypothetical protein
MVATINEGVAKYETLGRGREFVVSDRLRPEQKTAVRAVPRKWTGWCHCFHHFRAPTMPLSSYAFEGQVNAQVGGFLRYSRIAADLGQSAGRCTTFTA